MTDSNVMKRYLPVLGLSLVLAKGTGDFVISAMQLKSPELASAAFGTAAALLCFFGTYVVQESGKRQWHPVRRGLASLAFGAVAGGTLAYLAEYDARYQAERAAMPRIDATTVIETRPVTIADKYCHPNNRGAEITIEYEGKKMLTMCPR